MKIVNFGSLNIDHVYTLPHFVTAGETLVSSKLEFFCGGKGLNQSIALRRAGAQVLHAGLLGTDGDMLQARLEENDVDCSLLERVDAVNGHALIQVDEKGQNCIIVYGGSNRYFTGDTVERAMSRLEKGDMALLQNETNLTDMIARRCREKGVFLVLNPSPVDDDLLNEFPFDCVDLFVINEVEGRALTGCDEPDGICDRLLERYPRSRILLTLGSRGVLYRDTGQRHRHGIYEVPVVDTTAAGDTFTGFFVAALSRGETIPRCLEEASVASSLAVGVKGASNSIPTLAEVRQASLPYLPPEA